MSNSKIQQIFFLVLYFFLFVLLLLFSLFHLISPIVVFFNFLFMLRKNKKTKPKKVLWISMNLISCLLPDFIFFLTNFLLFQLELDWKNFSKCISNHSSYFSSLSTINYHFFLKPKENWQKKLKRRLLFFIRKQILKCKI